MPTAKLIFWAASSQKPEIGATGPTNVNEQLRIDDVVLTGTNLVRPKRSEDVVLTSSGRWWGGFLKDDIRDGHLTLMMDEGGNEQQSWGRLQQSDIRVRLRYHPVWGPLISNVILVLILFIGSFTSLFFKLTLPNSRQRMELKEKLDRLGAHVNDLSNNTGQRLIFFLRIQLKRMADLLDPKAPGGGRNTFSPIREALLIALIRTPHRFHTKRQLWAYCAPSQSRMPSRAGTKVAFGEPRTPHSSGAVSGAGFAKTQSVCFDATRITPMPF